MTVSVPAPWEFRLHRSVTIGQFVVLIYAVVFDLISEVGSPDGASLLAMALGTIYVIGTAAVPESWYRRRFGAETITLIGAFLTITAITLTGGPNSPYILLSMGPPILATMYGGLRTGLMTRFLSVALLFLVSLSQAEPGTEADAILVVLPAMGLYVAFVLLVTVIRRLLEDAHRQAGELAEATESATQKLENLEEIHGVLIRLSEDISAGRLNAVEVAADTLEAILARIPGSSGRLILDDEEGPVVLASRGVPPESPHPYEVPLSTADASVGSLELLTPQSLSEARSDRYRGVRSARQHRFRQPSVASEHRRLRRGRGADSSRPGDARRHRAFARFAGIGPGHGSDATGGACGTVR